MKKSKLEISLYVIIGILVVINLLSFYRLYERTQLGKKSLDLVVKAKEKLANIKMMDNYSYFYPASCLGDKTFDEAYVVSSNKGDYYFTASLADEMIDITSEADLKKTKLIAKKELLKNPKDLKNNEIIIIDSKTCEMKHDFDAYFKASPEECFIIDNGRVFGLSNDEKCQKMKVISLPSKIEKEEVSQVDTSIFRDLDLDVLDFSNVKTLRRIIKTGNFESGQNIKVKHLNIRDLEKLKVIGEYSFTKWNVETVSLINLNSLEEIQSEAFSNNLISDLYLKDLSKLKLLVSAFNNNKLKTLDLSQMPNLEELVYDAFSHNEIESLDLTKNLKLKKLGYRAFADNKISKLDLSKNKNLELIDFEAFTNNHLSELIFDDIGLEIIGNASFKNNKLKIVDLSKNKTIRKILQSAFADNPIEKITVNTDHNIDCVASNATNNKMIRELSNVAVHNIQSSC